MAICLERGADLHMAQLMPLPLTVSCFSKIQIGFTFLVLAHRVVPEKGPLNGCVCVHMSFGNSIVAHNFLRATALVRCMNLTMNNHLVDSHKQSMWKLHSLVLCTVV